MLTIAMVLVLAQAEPPSSACPGSGPSQASEGKPNVVLIVSDDQGWTDFGFMGHEAIRTPHLDKLASESALFPNGSVPTSLCRASLATILTGLYAHQHRICCNDPPAGVDRAAMHPFMRDAPALPRLLAGRGYRSFQTGKFWEGHFSNAGFTHGMTEKGRHGDAGLTIGRKTMKPIFDFIEGGTGPFFVWYAPMMPHLPHDPPERLLKKYAVEGRAPEVAKYWAMCEWFDETCGELLDYLDKKGLREKTLVLFVVDNGWMTGPEGRPGVRAKNSPYDAGVRTPVMVRWPGRVKPGRHDDLASTIDIAPTILAACGVKPEAPLPGVDLVAVADGRVRPAREAIFGEIFVHTSVDLERPAVNLTHRWIRQGSWKLIVPAKGGGAELYDLAADPHERKNLAAEKPEKAAELARSLDAWWSGR